MGYERPDQNRAWRGQRYGYRDQSQDYRGDHYRHDDDRGFFDRAGDELRSWFGDEEAERRRRQDEERDRRYGRSGFGASGGYASGGYGRGGYGPSQGGYSDYDRGVSGAYGGYGAAYGGGGAYAPYSGGTYRENSGDYGDDRYREWRRREIAALDRDYDEYRREHQSRFEQDFGSWRNTRMGQREALGRVQEHQEVVGSDGQHVGTVDHVRGDHILLTRSDAEAGGHHHSIPCGWVSQVNERVELNCTADQARMSWKDEERRSAMSGGEDEAAYRRSRPYAGV